MCPKRNTKRSREGVGVSLVFLEAPKVTEVEGEEKGVQSGKQGLRSGLGGLTHHLGSTNDDGAVGRGGKGGAGRGSNLGGV